MEAKSLTPCGLCLSAWPWPGYAGVEDAAHVFFTCDKEHACPCWAIFKRRELLPCVFCNLLGAVVLSVNSICSVRAGAWCLMATFKCQRFWIISLVVKDWWTIGCAWERIRFCCLSHQCYCSELCFPSLQSGCRDVFFLYLNCKKWIDLQFSWERVRVVAGELERVRWFGGTSFVIKRRVLTVCWCQSGKRSSCIQ